MVKFDPQEHHRRSIRLKGYDYASAGAYFVTVVAWHRESLFGKIVDKKMMLNRYGEIVERWWSEIPIHFPGVETGAFVIMPNHVHGIILIVERRGTASYSQGIPVPENEGINKISHVNDISPEIQGGNASRPPQRTSTFEGIPTLGQIVAYFKYKSTKEMNLLDNTGTVTKFWQRRRSFPTQ